MTTPGDRRAGRQLERVRHVPGAHRLTGADRSASSPPETAWATPGASAVPAQPLAAFSGHGGPGGGLGTHATRRVLKVDGRNALSALGALDAAHAGLSPTACGCAGRVAAPRPARSRPAPTRDADVSSRPGRRYGALRGLRDADEVDSGDAGAAVAALLNTNFVARAAAGGGRRADEAARL